MACEGMVHVRHPVEQDAAGIARVHVASWRTTYRGIVPADYLAGLSAEQREEFWIRVLTNPEAERVVLVAEDESGQIVGFASGGPERTGDPVYQGELYAIYLLATHQRRGIGRQLFQAVVEKLAEAGLTSMLLWVLADNPSRTVYDRLGGEPVRTQRIEIGGATLEEVAYGWRDMTAFASPRPSC